MLSLRARFHHASLKQQVMPNTNLPLSPAHRAHCRAFAPMSSVEWSHRCVVVFAGPPRADDETMK